jgi:Txe/YoeB family toxin of Txe-Axe toxin-antitoxin module
VKNLEFDADAFEDLVWWIESDRKKALKIIKLIREVQRDPFEGTGQPQGYFILRQAHLRINSEANSKSRLKTTNKGF